MWLCSEATRRPPWTSSPINPGLTLFHCHQQLHMDFGFMTLFDYV
ncbi:MAG TPA: multicopper oxidase domain-containing protein [Candidatus Angelobacter sp.]